VGLKISEFNSGPVLSGFNRRNISVKGLNDIAKSYHKLPVSL